MIPLETVLGRISTENQALVRQALLDAEEALPGLIKDRDSEEAHLHRRRKALDEAKNPSACNKHVSLQERLKDKLRKTK